MVAVDLDLVARLERAMLSSWPAFSVAFDGDWVIRMADGYTKRANSVTCLGADDADLDARIDRVAATYRERDLPAVFRLSPLASPALDGHLARRGWRRFDETIVMTSELGGIPELAAAPAEAAGCEIREVADAAWLSARRRIDGMCATAGAALERLLAVMMPPCGYGRIGDRARIDALGLMVVDAELAGLFDLMTATDARRRGLARRLIVALLRWSRQRGASTGWLAVVADNHPARRLYASLGFREVYRYHYRSNG